MSLGTMAVDYEVRVDFDRLRKERLQKAKDQMKKDGIGAYLCFDGENIRYITSTHHPNWARGKMARYCLLPRDAEPLLFDMGTVAAARKEPHGATWLHGKIFQAAGWGVAGAGPAIESVKKTLSDYGVANEPLAIDMLDVPVMKALQAANVKVVDAQASLLQARLIKTRDEIELIKTAAMMVEAGFDAIARAIRPGVKESDLVAIMNQVLYTMGSESVLNVQPTSGPRTNPHHHDFSDRSIRPGDTVMIDVVHAFNGYKTCYYRTFVCGRPTQEQKDLYRDCYTWLVDSEKVVRPGATTKDIVEKWPTAAQLGYKTEAEALALEVGHGIGLGHWEPPFMGRPDSIDHPFPIKEGMVFALETYAGKAGGSQGIRIEDEIVVTSNGYEVITKYPAEEITVCGL